MIYHWPQFNPYAVARQRSASHMRWNVWGDVYACLDDGGYCLDRTTEEDL